MNFVLRVIGIFIAVAVAVWLVPGIEVGGTVSTWASVLIIALIIALLNMTIKPILQLFGLPITVITLGIFYIIINTALLYLASWLANGLFGIDFIIAHTKWMIFKRIELFQFYFHNLVHTLFR